MKARRQRCTARISDGSRQCERWAINGGMVCATHGGRAPHVKQAAKERLAALVEPAIATLNKAIKSEDLSVGVRASQIVLDRTGFHPSQAVELYGREGEPVEVKIETVDVEKLSPEHRAALWSIIQSTEKPDQGDDENQES